jgi:hypothetical protein
MTDRLQPQAPDVQAGAARTAVVISRGCLVSISREHILDPCFGGTVRLP